MQRATSTKIVPGLDGMDYESRQRLRALHLYSMEGRRVRGEWRPDVLPYVR